MNTDKRSKLRAVLFDVDGTMADTERDGHRLAFNAAFKEFGLSWDWDVELYGELLFVTGGKERIRYFIERYSPDTLDKCDLDTWIADLHKTKTRHFVTLLGHGKIPLRPGVARLIHQLRYEKIKIAIATTTTPENVTALLKSTLGEDSPAWFDVIGAGDIVSQKKPSAEIYDWVVKQLGLIPQQCIAIEDSENGLRAACAANITTLITVNDYTCKQNFSGASMVLSDLGEPHQIFSVLGGNKLEDSWVNVELLKNLMHRNHPA